MTCTGSNGRPIGPGSAGFQSAGPWSYYVGAASFLIDPAKPAIGVPAAIATGLGALVVGWLVYDGLCRSAIGANDKVLGVVWFACLVFAAAVLDQVFASRAAYLHVGAMIGTVMVGNGSSLSFPTSARSSQPCSPVASPIRRWARPPSSVRSTTIT